MRRVLLVVLSLSVLGGTYCSDDTPTLSERTQSQKPLSAYMGLADEIFDKHKQCETYVYGAVNDALHDKEPGLRYPRSSDEYVECKRALDKQKRAYIEAARAYLDMSPDTFVFPLRLSSGKVVYLPKPADENDLKTYNKFEFDINEELCVVNSMCDLINQKMNPENREEKKDRTLYTTPSSRCVDLVNYLKLTYLTKKDVDRFTLERYGGISVMCPEGRHMFSFNMIDMERSMDSINSEPQKPIEIVNSQLQKVPQKLEAGDESKETTTTSSNSSSEKKSKLETPSVEHDNNQDNSESKMALSVPKPDHESHKSTEKSSIFDELEPSVSTEENIPEKSVEESKIVKSESSKEIQTQELHQKENNNSYKTSGWIPESAIGRYDDTLENTDLVNSNHDNDKKKENQEEEDNAYIHFKSGPTNNGLRKLFRYRVRIISKSGDVRVFRLITTTQRPTDSTDYTDEEEDSKLRTPVLTDVDSNHGSPDAKPDESLHAVYHHMENPNVMKPDTFTETLGDTIVNLEDDCEELLEYGTNLHKEGKLDSILTFQKHYQECIRVLFSLKKLYIDKHGITEYDTINTVFPVKLSNGKEKLVLYPPKFISEGEKTNLPVDPSRLHPKSESTMLGSSSGKSDQFESTTFKNNEPMENPAFIPNDRFIGSLTKGSSPPETSTLTKISNLLHINGAHNQNSIAE